MRRIAHACMHPFHSTGPQPQRQPAQVEAFGPPRRPTGGAAPPPLDTRPGPAAHEATSRSALLCPVACTAPRLLANARRIRIQDVRAWRSASVRSVNSWCAQAGRVGRLGVGWLGTSVDRPPEPLSIGTSQEGRRIAVSIACHKVAGYLHRFVPRTWAYGTISLVPFHACSLHSVCRSTPHTTPMLFTLHSVWSRVQT